MMMEILPGWRYRIPSRRSLQGSFPRVVQTPGEPVVHGESLLNLCLLITDLPEEVVVKVVFPLVCFRGQKMGVKLVREVVALKASDKWECK